jgi:MFS family permease
MRALSVSRQIVLNAYWIPLNFQNAALLTIAVPAALLRFRGIDYVSELALLASLVAVISMVVPPVAGEISDRLHRAGSPRRWVILLGAAVNAGALLWMIAAPAPNVFALAVVVATLGQNVSAAAYSALIPEIVPREDWGAASGYQGVGTLVGTIAGLVVASIATASTTLLAAAIVVVAGALTVLATPEGRFVEGEHAHVSDWANFAIAFTSRFWTFFGLVMLNTFVLYFFRDVLKVSNPSAGTGFVGVMAMVGALVSSVLMGYLSDRVPRKWVVALAGVPMTLAAVGFALVPQERWILIFAIFFGLGYGAFVSTGWALAIDSVPKLGNVARDLGIWGIAANLPAIFAPQVGKWILGSYATPLSGYRALFVAAGLSFALGSIVVLWTGRRKQAATLPASGGPLQAFAMAVIHPYYLTAYRIRGWGRLPRRRGATLAISNHQHDLDTTGVIMRLSVQGPWLHPIYAVTSRRLFEPGFMGVRLAWLEPVVRNMNWGWLFGLIGMLPIENELRRRSVASLAWWVYVRHGDLPLTEVFRDGTGAGALGAGDGATLLSLFAKEKYKPARDAYVSIAALREPYRTEVVGQTRAYLAGDLERIENVLRAGGTLYLTPEGRYSKDGRIGRFREALDKLAHLGTVYVLAVSYDPFVGRRLSLLYRALPAQDPSDLRSSLAAPRPVTTSQLIATWIVNRSAPFHAEEALAGARRLLQSLPVDAFIDPELVADPGKMVGSALATMTRLGILQHVGDHYRLSDRRRHPQFPDVADIVRHQANFFEETVEALRRLESRS